MRTILAGLALAFTGAVWAEEAPECPEGWQCKFVAEAPLGAPVEPPEPPVEPPVDPPIEPPPTDPSAELHFKERCDRSDAIACQTWESPEDVFASADIPNGRWTGVPNTAQNPATNGKCRWTENGSSDHNCYPPFGQREHENGVQQEPTDQWTCERRRELNNDPSFDGSDELRSQLRSPCYWEEGNAAVLTDWNDLGSSIQHLGIATWPDRPIYQALEYTYEIAFGQSMFRTRKGSYTSKLARMYRIKGGDCGKQDRILSERLLSIGPERIDLGYYYNCPAAYSPAQSTFEVTPDEACSGILPRTEGQPCLPRWFRVTRILDMAAKTIRSIVVDVETGETELDYTHQPETMLGPMQLDSFKWLLHSTSHQRCTDDCDQWTSGHMAVRYVTVHGR